MPTTIEERHHQIAEILIDERISDMTKFLMEDYGYSLEKALDAIYNSNTLRLLEMEDGELYVQSSPYVYDILIKELHLCPVLDDAPEMNVAKTIR